MTLLHAVVSMMTVRSSFFLQLMIEHLWISGAAIGIAIIVGGTAGILIYRYERAAECRVRCSPRSMAVR